MATSDSFVLPPGRHQLPLLANDIAPQGIDVSVDIESLADATVTIDQGMVTVDIPEDQTADVTFTYTVSSLEATASADVVVSVIHLGANSATDSAEIAQPIDAGTGGLESETADNNRSLGVFDVDLGVPPALVAVTELRLPWLQFLATLVACSLTILVVRRRNRRSGFVAIDKVARVETSRSAGDNGDFHLRHDTEGIWTTGRERDGRIEIHTPNGRTWVAEGRISRHDPEQ